MWTNESFLDFNSKQSPPLASSTAECFPSIFNCSSKYSFPGSSVREAERGQGYFLVEVSSVASQKISSHMTSICSSLVSQNKKVALLFQNSLDDNFEVAKLLLETVLFHLAPVPQTKTKAGIWKCNSKLTLSNVNKCTNARHVHVTEVNFWIVQSPVNKVQNPSSR